MTLKGRVSPFGNPRIKACSQLPVAYRSVPRPSSPLGAKASTKCPSRRLISATSPSRNSRTRTPIADDRRTITGIAAERVRTAAGKTRSQQQPAPALSSRCRPGSRRAAPMPKLGTDFYSSSRCPISRRRALTRRRCLVVSLVAHLAVDRRRPARCRAREARLSTVHWTVDCAPLGRDPRAVALGRPSYRPSTGRSISLREPEGLVEAIGIEPTTSCLQSTCSPS